MHIRMKNTNHNFFTLSVLAVIILLSIILPFRLLNSTMSTIKTSDNIPEVESPPATSASQEYSSDNNTQTQGNTLEKTYELAYIVGNSIYIMNSDGSNNRLITKIFNYGNSIFYRPMIRFSPDGTKLVAWEDKSHYREDGSKDIFVINVSDGSYFKIGSGQNPSWSPDSKKIVYNSIENELTNHEDIYSYDLERNNQKTLLNRGSHDINPIFSPNGDYIAFKSCFTNLATGQYCDYELWLMVCNGNNPYCLSDSHYINYFFWSEDSKSVIYNTKTEGGDLYEIRISDGVMLPHLNANQDKYNNFYAQTISPDGNQTVSISEDNIIITDINHIQQEQIVLSNIMDLKYVIFAPE
jgi:Tol biopolymer transport system component